MLGIPVRAGGSRAPVPRVSPLKAELLRIGALVAGALAGMALGRWEKARRRRR